MFTNQEMLEINHRQEQEEQQHITLETTLTVTIQPNKTTHHQNICNTLRSHPRVTVGLCIVANLVLPVLAPFVIYSLLKLKLDSTRTNGRHDKIFKHKSLLAKITLMSIILCTILAVVSVIIVGTISYQQSMKSESTINETFRTELLSKQMKKIFQFEQSSSTSLGISKLKSSQNGGCRNKTVKKTDDKIEGLELGGNTPFGLAGKDCTTLKGSKRHPGMVNSFADLASHKWKYKVLNSTHIFVYSPYSKQNFTKALNTDLPEQ
ncbi:hypothetical protein ACF0H5_014750 [Mactra antiquata]